MFLTPLVLVAVEGLPDQWQFEAPLMWADQVFGVLTVPAGFPTDLASIPRCLRNIPDLDPDGLSRRPAAMHDWLYGSKEGRAHGKDFADNFIRAALLSEGAAHEVAEEFYLAVHLFGGSSWNGDGAKGLATEG